MEMVCCAQEHWWIIIQILFHKIDSLASVRGATSKFRSLLKAYLYFLYGDGAKMISQFSVSINQVDVTFPNRNKSYHSSGSVLEFKWPFQPRYFFFSIVPLSLWHHITTRGGNACLKDGICVILLCLSSEA